mmetsp:Transcript_916/g.1810  ORF Transcript_916/g.1810 Transcript_916/m.1810 type:complete len:86 (+) Transcript_916:2932-3189(+)
MRWLSQLARHCVWLLAVHFGGWGQKPQRHLCCYRSCYFSVAIGFGVHAQIGEEPATLQLHKQLWSTKRGAEAVTLRISHDPVLPG